MLSTLSSARLFYFSRKGEDGNVGLVEVLVEDSQRPRMHDLVEHPPSARLGAGVLPGAMPDGVIVEEQRPSRQVAKRAAVVLHVLPPDL